VAGEVRLFEHGEFEQVMLRTAEHFGVNEQFVEKDYYVTEILRVVADRLGDRAIFKGGTSLSKGWGLISRFSEDIDLFVNRDGFDPRPGKNRVDKILRDLAEAVGEHPALTWLRDESMPKHGLARADYFEYGTLFAALPGIRAAVRLEPGVRSGTFPTSAVPISSLVGQYLREQGPDDLAEDLAGFDMTLLHFRRTFVEKMFALHGKVVRFVEGGDALDRDARHYADLYVLAGTDEVRAMLASPEYGQIRGDCDQKSVEFFQERYVPPDGLSFAASPALFPEEGLRNQLAGEYDAQCNVLFSGGEYPPFADVLARFEEIRTLL
jgi:nucleotidyltransferase AbiEii toxin of type IV toxin-antitoxin system